MLALTRKVGQQIFLGDKEVIIKILKVDRRTGEVRVGIEAPKDINIAREEVFDVINASKSKELSHGVSKVLS